ncbi:hypothetical protein ABN196_08370 [Proteus terrae]|uniref:hypothetical protein n=1 Tax=Proteus terrae TaxID=1574161 RepID=UPI0032D9EB98
MASEVGTDKIYKTSVLDMAKKYGATVAMIERSIKVLIALKIIEKVQSTSQIKSGRPISIYRINDDMGMGCLKVKLCKPYFEKFKKFIDKGILNNKQMSLSNKLLSLILFIHSDIGGRVKELDSKTIKNLTGFSRERLRTQIKKLCKIEFIHYQINGVSIPDSGLFNSIYFLNFNVLENSLSVPVELKPMHQLINTARNKDHAYRVEFRRFIVNFFNDRDDIYNYFEFIMLLSLEKIINNQFKKDKLKFKSNIDSECDVEAKSLVKKLFNIDKNNDKYNYLVEYFYWFLYDSMASIYDEDYYVIFGFLNSKSCVRYYKLDNVFSE